MSTSHFLLCLAERAARVAGGELGFKDTVENLEVRSQVGRSRASPFAIPGYVAKGDMMLWQTM